MSFPETWREGMRIIPMQDGISDPNFAKTFKMECAGCGGELSEFTSHMTMRDLWEIYSEHLRKSHRIFG